MEHNKPSLRQILVAAVFVLIIGGFLILNLAIPAPKLLASERRAPAALPKLTVNSVLSAGFMNKFETYAADRFVQRDKFRTLRAVTVFDVFWQTDKSGLYFGKSGVGEFKQANPVNVQKTAGLIKKVADRIAGCNIYYSIVPDKSLYAGKYLPGFDLNAAEAILGSALNGYDYIPLADSVTADSFYKTDIHWDQAKIDDALNRLCSAMGVTPDLSGYSETLAGTFHGVYTGQMALPMAPDQMTYLSCPAVAARYLNPVTLSFDALPVYNLQGLAGVDPYDVFLRGPQPLIVLENPNATSSRELYLFRDSFSSSLAPLLASAYGKVTLIDLRYIDAGMLDQFISFDPGADVLFLYSSQILNNPSILKVQ